MASLLGKKSKKVLPFAAFGKFAVHGSSREYRKFIDDTNSFTDGSDAIHGEACINLGTVPEIR